MLSIAVIVVVLAQAMSAAMPMLHLPDKTPAAHHQGKHDCCPKPVVEIRDCCPKRISCPHQQRTAGSCCCADSGETGVPTRKEIATKPLASPAVANTAPFSAEGHAWLTAAQVGPPLDNSPPILVLRN